MGWDLATLFRRHSHEITRFLRGRGLSEDAAADLTQDAFVRALSLRERDVDNPRAFLFTVSRNLLVDHKRRERAAPIDDLPEEALLCVADPAPSAETVLYDRQRLLITEAALAELPERTRRAFQLHRFEGLTIAEAAPQVGLSTTQTWALIRDAFRHIRARLRDV